MAITEEAFDLWDQWKRDIKLTQGDAMTKLILDNLGTKKEPCAVKISQEKRVKP